LRAETLDEWNVALRVWLLGELLFPRALVGTR